MPEESTEINQGEKMSTERTPEQGLSTVPEKKSSLKIRSIAGGSQENDTQKEPSFEEKIEELKNNIVKNDKLSRLITVAGLPRNQTPERFNEYINSVDQLFTNGEISEEEWVAAATVLTEKRDQLRPQQKAQTASGTTNGVKEGLSEVFGVEPIEKERERWLLVEWRGNPIKFGPTQEPRFYKKLSEQEQELFDTRWQLARAAFFKRSSQTEKGVENQDLTMLSMEKMERLYKMPGVKEALSWYARKIVDMEKLSSGKTIWDCKNEIEFEASRGEMQHYLVEKKIFVGKDQEEQKRAAKEADAVAWNWMWCSNLIESVDSRYFIEGPRKRHGDLPGAMISDDWRSTLHPQEKFEDKVSKEQEWGAFGKWGATQVKVIKEATQFNKDKDEFEFHFAPSEGEFWQSRRTNQLAKKGGNVIEVLVPECYPTTTTKSFWEGIKFGDFTLLDCLLDGRTIDWRQIESGFWGDYVGVKLNKSVKLAEYFDGGKPLKEKEEIVWVTPLNDILLRLGLKDLLKEQVDKKLSNQTLSKLKVWLVAASYGGVRYPEKSTFTHPLKWLDGQVMRSRLGSSQIGFLEKDESL